MRVELAIPWAPLRLVGQSGLVHCGDRPVVGADDQIGSGLPRLAASGDVRREMPLPSGAGASRCVLRGCMTNQNMIDCPNVPATNDWRSHSSAKSELDALASKVALTIREAALLGIGSERQLRQLIRDGVIKKSLLRTGHGSRRRKVRLAKDLLLEELRLKS